MNKEILPYPICSVVAVFKMLVRILNTLRSRIWDRVVFLCSDYLNLRFNNMECARRLWSSGKLNFKGLTLKLLSFQHKSLICYLSQSRRLSSLSGGGYFLTRLYKNYNYLFLPYGEFLSG